MGVWDHLPVQNLIDLQRLAALKQMGRRAKELYDEGYVADADRVLDEMNERRQAWNQEAA